MRQEKRPRSFTRKAAADPVDEMTLPKHSDRTGIFLPVNSRKQFCGAIYRPLMPNRKLRAAARRDRERTDQSFIR